MPRARAMVTRGDLGDIYDMVLASRDHVPPDRNFIPGSGGIFRDLHVHDLDIASWIADSPIEFVHATRAIRGAGDYAEIVTRSARYMSTRSLEHFEDTLSPVLLRVHRSHLVRLGAIERTEPAGNGRLQLHLVNQDTVTTSREGGKRLRALVR